MTTANTSNAYLFTVTGFSDDADRVAAPLVLANAALAAGGDVLMWLSLEGVELARKGVENPGFPSRQSGGCPVNLLKEQDLRVP